MPKTTPAARRRYTGAAVAPDDNELGWKETVRMNPGEVTRVCMKFDLPAVPFTVPNSPGWPTTTGSMARSTSGTATSSSTRSTT